MTVAAQVKLEETQATTVGPYTVTASAAGVDFSNCTMQLGVLKKGEVVIDKALTVTSSGMGSCVGVLQLTAAETVALVDAYRYAVEITFPSGLVKPLLSGDMTFARGIP